jgi:hypothetical protein
MAPGMRNYKMHIEIFPIPQPTIHNEQHAFRGIAKRGCHLNVLQQFLSNNPPIYRFFPCFSLI